MTPRPSQPIRDGSTPASLFLILKHIQHRLSEVPKRTELQQPTAINASCLSPVPSLCNYSHSLSCTSQNNLSNKLPTPNFLFYGLHFQRTLNKTSFRLCYPVFLYFLLSNFTSQRVKNYSRLKKKKNMHYQKEKWDFQALFSFISSTGLEKVEKTRKPKCL